VASPSPIRTSAACASGARSPDAPTDPIDGTTGVTPADSSRARCSHTTGRTPERPRASEAQSTIIIARTTSSGSGSPTPEACESTRFRCTSRSCASSMRLPASDPNPVLTP
jgi:hypothetical protein